jgi:hypothetical protein
MNYFFPKKKLKKIANFCHMAYATWFLDHVADYSHMDLDHIATVRQVAQIHVATCGHVDYGHVAMWIWATCLTVATWLMLATWMVNHVATVPCGLRPRQRRG